MTKVFPRTRNFDISLIPIGTSYLNQLCFRIFLTKFSNKLGHKTKEIGVVAFRPLHKLMSLFVFQQHMVQHRQFLVVLYPLKTNF
jgi:hypothetical protein